MKMENKLDMNKKLKTSHNIVKNLDNDTINKIIPIKKEIIVIKNNSNKNSTIKEIIVENKIKRSLKT